jgi:PTS system sucrose-specific IIC component
MNPVSEAADMAARKLNPFQRKRVCSNIFVPIIPGDCGTPVLLMGAGMVKTTAGSMPDNALYIMLDMCSSARLLFCRS